MEVTGDRDRESVKVDMMEAGGHCILGMGRPTKKLLRWLAPLDETGKGLRFISVVGPAGIGKTTVAMELCKQLSCKPSEGHYNFQCKVMAKASRRANRNELLLRDIISQISDPAPAHSDKPQSMKLELLVSHASELLQDKRYGKN